MTVAGRVSRQVTAFWVAQGLENVGTRVGRVILARCARRWWCRGHVPADDVAAQRGRVDGQVCGVGAQPPARAMTPWRRGCGWWRPARCARSCCSTGVEGPGCGRRAALGARRPPVLHRRGAGAVCVGRQPSGGPVLDAAGATRSMARTARTGRTGSASAQEGRPAPPCAGRAPCVTCRGTGQLSPTGSAANLGGRPSKDYRPGVTTGGWWTSDGKVRHRRADGTSGSRCGSESGPMRPAANSLTACDDCQSDNQTLERTDRSLPTPPNGHFRP